MLEENLSKLGFSPSEIKIYLHLLTKGASYANRLSAETKINRTNVYEALARLVSKGVVAFIVRNKVKWYEAKSPDAVMSLVDEKSEELDKTRKELKSEVSKLKNSIPKDRRELEANVFVGKKGLRMLFEEILETGKPILLVAAELQFKKLFGPYFELWHKKRAEKKIKQKTIFPKRFRGKVKSRKLLEYKFVDDKYTNPTTTIICGDNCLFIQWSKDPVAIKIQNKEIVKSHLNYFDMLWRS